MSRVTVQSDIRERVKKSIDRASDTTVKMIFAMLEVQEQEAKEGGREAEIARRFEAYEQGTITPITLDELEARVRKSHKERLKSAS